MKGTGEKFLLSSLAADQQHFYREVKVIEGYSMKNISLTGTILDSSMKVGWNYPVFDYLCLVFREVAIKKKPCAVPGITVGHEMVGVVEQTGIRCHFGEAGRPGHRQCRLLSIV